MANILASSRVSGVWQDRHNERVSKVTSARVMALPVDNGQGPSIVAMLWAWKNYADAHARRFESLIGEDYVLGPAWKDLGLSIRALLNGETADLDCGTLDAFILDTLKENGFPEEL